MYPTTSKIMLHPAEQHLQSAHKLFKVRLYIDALDSAKRALDVLNETHDSLAHEGGSAYIYSGFGALRFRIGMIIAACQSARGNAQYLGIPAYNQLVSDNTQEMRAMASLGLGISHLLAYLHEDERPGSLPGSLMLARDALLAGRTTQMKAPGFTNEIAATLLSVLAQVHLLLDDTDEAEHCVRASEELFLLSRSSRRSSNQFIIADIHRRRGNLRQMWSWRSHGLMQAFRLPGSLATRFAACRMFFARGGTARIAPLKQELLIP